MSGASTLAAARRRHGVVGFVALVCVAALTLAVALAPMPPPGTPNWAALPLLALLLVAATRMVVPFRFGGSVDSINLVEAALAPLLIAFPPLAVVAVVALSQVANGLIRRLSTLKTAFNTGMWTLAAGLGSAVMAGLDPQLVWPDRILALLLALATVGLVNTLAVTAVFALAEGRGGDRVSRLPVMQVRSVAEWGVNVALGLLLALAYLTWAAAVALFFVPLLMLHLAYRSYSSARADQALLAAAHQAATRLTEPLQPRTAISEFLREIGECFDATTVQLVLQEGPEREIHRLDRLSGRYTVRYEGHDVASLEGAVAGLPGPCHASCGEDDALAPLLTASGWQKCLAAPLHDGDRVMGGLLILDRGGFAGSRASELAILDALAREVAVALSKGRLMAHVLDERRKFAEIVSSASDGICTFANDGAVLTWNPALERITGLPAHEAIGRTDVPERLAVRTPDGEPVELTRRSLVDLPEAIRLTALDGTPRYLVCSYSSGGPDSDSAALIVVARDVTPREEHETLLQEFGKMVKADAARRLVVEQLQGAVVPPPLSISDAELAAAYEPSDPSAPTGGDLYDWIELPSGDVHIAAVDVLGHGVVATKDALAVVHSLRAVTAAGTPLELVVAEADRLLHTQHPDLVATVLVARYSPGTGKLLVASGGHPPPLVVRSNGDIEELSTTGGVIGWPNAGTDHITETSIDPGDALVMYTDGLVEAHKDIVDGIRVLRHHAAEVASVAGVSAGEFARELVRRGLEGADRRDDALALVLRRDVAPVVLERAAWQCLPDRAEASATRRDLCAWLAERGLDETDCGLVAGELLANAARSARSYVAATIEIREDSVTVDVSDDGEATPYLEEKGRLLPPADVEGKRGLYLVRSLSERVDVLTTQSGTTIRAMVSRPGALDGGVTVRESRERVPGDAAASPRPRMR